MKEWQFGVILVCLVGAWPGGAAGQRSDPASSEIIQIDGSKNPELIPQWSAWGYAFRVFAGGPRMLPSSVLAHVTEAEQALIIREADAVQGSDVTCMARHRKILADRGNKKLEDVDKEVRELSLDCRWETLRARDRVLAGLTPDAQAALTAFVESTKAGTSLSIPKKDLARFREPE